MHRTLDPIRLPFTDICSIFNDVRWPEKCGEVRRELHSPQEDIDFRGQKKTPKQAGRRVSKQENTWRKAPGPSARWLQGHGTHSGSCCVVSYWHTVSLLSDIPCVCLCMRVSQSVIVSACLFNDLYNWYRTFRICSFLITSDVSVCVKECYCVNLFGWPRDRAPTRVPLQPKQTLHGSIPAAWLEVDVSNKSLIMDKF